MVVVSAWREQAKRQTSDLSRVASATRPLPPITHKLAKIESSSLISTTDKRYLYTVSEYVVNESTPFAPVASANTATLTALSVSELSNGTNPATGYYSYGVSKATLAGTGFVATVIPNGTFVLMVPHRKSSGTLVWLIINTQAIDGVCP